MSTKKHETLFCMSQNSPNNEDHGMNQMDLNNDNRWKSRQELTYALMNMLRKWVSLIIIFTICIKAFVICYFFLFLVYPSTLFLQIEESKKNADDVQQLPETDTIFKNTFV